MSERKFFQPPKLTPLRMTLAMGMAMVTDGLQIIFAVPPAPEIIDVIAMILTVWLVGFHLLLLPTFVVEFIPIAGMLPTWTACVAAVIALRKRESRIESAKDVTPAKSEIKDVTGEKQDVPELE